MNEHEDLETLLRGYRPVGPPPELRARVLRNVRVPRRPWSILLEWLPAAAAVLLVALFQMLAAYERSRVFEHFSPDPVEVSADVLREFMHE